MDDDTDKNNQADDGVDNDDLLDVELGFNPDQDDLNGEQMDKDHNCVDDSMQKKSEEPEGQFHDDEGLDDDGPNEFEQHEDHAEKSEEVKGQDEGDGNTEGKNGNEEKKEEKEKKENAKKDWIAIVEADEGKLYTELQKIGKLISRQQKVSEIKRRAKKHRMRVFPITLDELNTSYIRSVLEMCSQVQMKWVTKRTDDGVIMNGILEMTFARLKDAEEQKKKLKEFKKEVSVWDNYDNSHEEETNRKFNKMAGIPVDADANNKLTLLSPSLPTSVTEDELWQLFPNAREIWLITGGKRHHAYVKFLDEEALQKTLTKLREEGPPRDEFNFCRLVRYYEVEHAIKYTRSGGSQRSDRHRSRSPRRERHSNLSHGHSSRSETSDKKKTEHKSKSSSGDPESSPSKSDNKSGNVGTGKVEPFVQSAFDTDDKKMQSEEPETEKAASLGSESKSDKKDSKSSIAELKSDEKELKSKPKGSRSDGKDPRSESRSVRRRSSDHSKTSPSRSESKSFSRGSSSRSHRSRDRSRSRSRSHGRSDHRRRFDIRRRPDQNKILIPLRKRDRSPRHMRHSSLLGPPPGPVPSLLATGPMPSAPMMMGRPLENVLSQLQRPNIAQPMMNPQVQHQQGLQVLDNLLSTIGKLSNQSGSMQHVIQGDDDYRKRPMLHQRSRSRSPVGRGHSPMLAYSEPSKRIRVMDHAREKVYTRDDFGESHQDSYTRSNADSFMPSDFNRGEEYMTSNHPDNYRGYNQQFGQAERGYDSGHIATQHQVRDTFTDQRSFPATDTVRIGRPIETVMASDISQVKKDTARLEGEYALMMNQIGQGQQRGPMASVYRPNYY